MKMLNTYLYMKWCGFEMVIWRIRILLGGQAPGLVEKKSF